jgi:hypothetical protein
MLQEDSALCGNLRLSYALRKRFGLLAPVLERRARSARRLDVAPDLLDQLGLARERLLVA